MGGGSRNGAGARAREAAPAACLAVMLKAPERAKSRLASQIGVLAREAAEHLWACAYEDAAAWRGPLCFAPASDSDCLWLEGRIAAPAADDAVAVAAAVAAAGDSLMEAIDGAGGRFGAVILVQPEGNLGTRINFVAAALRLRGFGRQIFIGTDCPELTPAYLERAACLLVDHDAVLGPAQDGGVVLMAAKRPWPPLHDLPWSHADLGAALEILLRAEGWSVARLETLADIDTAEDLAAAARRLTGEARPERRALVRWIEQRGLGRRVAQPNRDVDSEPTSNSGVALVIPVRGDVEPLRALLERVAAWTCRPAEIIVVSAGVDAALERLCVEHGCRLIVAEANRGAQMDAGARAATESMLWFVHADSSLPTSGLQAIAAASTAGADGGCFRFAFQGDATWYKSLLARLVALRVRCGGIPYGDQGLFVRREAYFACGGFPHQPLFEEVRLVKRLRRRGAFRLLPEAIGVSPRRWERDGWWRRTLLNRWLALRYRLGASAECLARMYHGT